MDRAFKLTKLIILANLLSPDDFGLMGIALLTLAMFKQMSKLGFDAALIQHQEDDVSKYFDTTWVMKVGRGIILGVIAYLAAPYAAVFFNEPRTTDIIRVIAISPIIFGMRNPGVVYLKKNLEFHKQFVYKISGTIGDVSIAISFGILYHNVWALVFGLLAGNIIQTLASYWIHDYRPWPTFDIAFAKELFEYGRWFTVSGVILFLLAQGDDAFVGWFIGATALGYYQIAFRFSTAPSTELTQVISSILFPTYSQIQDDKAKLREGYFKVAQIITFLSIPMAIGILMVAPIFVQGVLGQQWLAATTVMQVLAIFGLVRSIGVLDGPLLAAIGRPDIPTKVQSVQLLIISLIIYPLTDKWAIFGTAIAVTTGVIVATIFKNYLTITKIDAQYYRYIRTVGYPSVASVIMAGGVFATRRIIHIESQIIMLLVMVAVGIILYGSVMLGIEWKSDYNISSVFQEICRSIRLN